MIRLDGCRALITGASAGIGCEFARQLADRASALVLVARREQRLEELRTELIARHPHLRIETCKMDLAEHSTIDQLTEWLGELGLPIDLLVNNAGLGDIGSFATSDPGRTEMMLEVNVVALTRLARAFLPAMIERGHGGILNVSSSASFLPIPNFAVYAATKAYVTSFSEALRTELHGTGVHVSALCPGPVRTEFSEVARREGSRAQSEPEIAYVSVEAVVAEALKGIEKNRPIVIPGALMKFGMSLVRLIPLPVLRLAGRGYAKQED
jgi:short-subunit dehydrogenase